VTIIKTYSLRNNYSDAKDCGAGWGILNHCPEVVVPDEEDVESILSLGAWQ